MKPNIGAFVIYRGTADKKGLMRLTGSENPAEALVAAGGQIVNSSPWLRTGASALVLRPGPEPLLVAFGDVSDAGRRDFVRLQRRLALADSLGIYVDYKQVEIDTARLAAKFLTRYSKAELLEYSYTAIPRGGIFVLGMLSYLLDLPRDRINNPRNRSDTLVVIDDCSLSGLRFKEFLKDIDNPHVVFCPLYSHPDLRARICEREHRVDAVISAVDLIDHANKIYGAEYEAWRERWENESGKETYWIGQPDYVAFPWGAPEVSFPEDSSPGDEPDWGFIPESRSLKNSSLVTCGSTSSVLQVQMEGQGPIRCAKDVVFADLGPESLILARCDRQADSGAAYLLENSTCMMFRALVENGSIEPVLSIVSEYYKTGLDTVRADLLSFLNELLEKGLMESV